MNTYKSWKEVEREVEQLMISLAKLTYNDDLVLPPKRMKNIQKVIFDEVTGSFEHHSKKEVA